RLEHAPTLVERTEARTAVGLPGSGAARRVGVACPRRPPGPCLSSASASLKVRKSSLAGVKRAARLPGAAELTFGIEQASRGGDVVGEGHPPVALSGAGEPQAFGSDRLEREIVER